MTDFKGTIEKYKGLLPVSSSISAPEAERRAGEFLVAMAHITEFRHFFSEDKIRCLSLQTATYAEELAKGTAKTVTENKTTAEASARYMASREDLERIENDLSYLKAFYEIFMAAHVFYRNMCKGESF